MPTLPSDPITNLLYGTPESVCLKTKGSAALSIVSKINLQFDSLIYWKYINAESLIIGFLPYSLKIICLESFIRIFPLVLILPLTVKASLASWVKIPTCPVVFIVIASVNAV